jgi:hypothetical protein
MAQTPFNPTPGVSTHQDCVDTINLNVTDAESRLGSLESAPPAHTHTVSEITDIAANYAPISHTHTVAQITDIAANYAPISHTHTVAQITDIAANYAPISHTHTVADVNSSTAASGYVMTADGGGNATWEEPQGGEGGGGRFSLTTVTTATYTQIPQHTHHLYDDTDLGGGESGSGSGSGSGGSGPCMTVELLDPTLHDGVTIHKKIGSSCDVLLLAPSGCTIDGVVSDGSVSGYVLTSQYESVSIFSDGVSGYYIQ